MTSRDKIISKIKLYSKEEIEDKVFDIPDVFTDSVAEDKVQKFISENVKVSVKMEVVSDKNELHKVLSDIISQHCISGISADKKLADKLSYFNIPVHFIDTQKPESKAELSETKCFLEECFLACADTGTLIFYGSELNSNYQSLYPETHIVILNETNIKGFQYCFNEIANLRQSYQNVVCVTGPSRTADIEKILVLGVHGPKNLFVIIERK